MPSQYWRHNCRCRSTGVRAGAHLCRTCGVLGEFDGWHLSMMESMACFQYVYGIKPLGPHREMADRLFSDMRTECERCSGRRLLDEEGGASWRACPVCEGTGGHWNRPLDEVDAALVRVLEEFPDAGAPKGTINFMSSALIRDLGNNVMIDAAPERRPPYGTPGPGRSGGKVVQTAWDRIFNDGVPDVEDSPEHLTDLPKDGKRVKEPTDSCFYVGGHTTRRLAGRRVYAYHFVSGSLQWPRKLPRTPGCSKRGLSYVAVAAAFAEAERALGRNWKLKGHGHCRRVSLYGCYSRCVRAAISSWELMTPGGCGSSRTLVPLALVERAAQILNVAVKILVRQEYLWSWSGPCCAKG